MTPGGQLSAGSLYCNGLQNLFGNGLADIGYIGGTDKLKFHTAYTGEPQFQFAVQVKDTCGFYREGLDFAVGKSGEILLFAGNALYINGNNPLIGKYNTVANALIGADVLFTLHKDGCHHLFECVVVDRTELYKGSIIKIDHKILPSFSLIFPAGVCVCGGAAGCRWGGALPVLPCGHGGHRLPLPQKWLHRSAG